MSRFTNNVKTALLMGGLMGLFLAVGSLYGQQGMTFALVFGGLFNVGAWFFSDKIAIATMRGQEVGADSAGVAGEVYHLVDELRQRAGLPMPRVYVCPQECAECVCDGALAISRGCGGDGGGAARAVAG